MASTRLVLLRVHQRETALDLREELATLAARAGAPDLFALTTCHRVECYGAAPLETDPRSWIVERTGIDPDASGGRGAAVELDGAAASHLMRVAAGLDSAIQGEGQILGQLRRAHDLARAAGGLDPLLGALVRAALHLGRELRAATPLGRVRRSMGSLAVEVGTALLPDPRSAAALVVGAGEVGRLATRALAGRVGSLVIANRDPERAREVARITAARVVGLAELDHELERADLVISAADTRGTVLTSERLARRLARGPLVLIDIAVPRSVAPEDRALPGLRYRSVDDLREESAGLSEDTLREAEARCAAEAARFVAARRARSAATTIEALHERAERLRRRQLDRALAKLGHLGERDRRIVDALSTGLTRALLHAPTVALREAPDRAVAVRELFGLGERT